MIDYTNSFGLGTLLLAFPTSVLAWFQIKGAHRANEVQKQLDEKARQDEKAAQAAIVRQQEVQEIVRLIYDDQKPINGRRTGKLIDDMNKLLIETSDQVGVLAMSVAAHHADSSIHTPHGELAVTGKLVLDATEPPPA